MGYGTYFESALSEVGIGFFTSKDYPDRKSSYFYRAKSATTWTSGEANGPGLTMTITEDYTSGGESSSSSSSSESGGGTFTFPESFSVTDCSCSLGATYASFTRTSNTTTVNGTNYPVYSMTHPSPMYGTYNIYVCQYKQGSAGVFWALNNRDTYSATDDGYNSLGALGCVAAGSDGLPSSTTWTSKNGTATVSWT